MRGPAHRRRSSPIPLESGAAVFQFEILNSNEGSLILNPFEFLSPQNDYKVILSGESKLIVIPLYAGSWDMGSQYFST